MKKKRFIVILLIAVLAIFGITKFLGRNAAADPVELSYMELIRMVENDSVDALEITSGSKEVSITLKDDSGKYVANVPNEEIFLEYLQEKVVSGQQMSVDVKEESSSGFTIFDIIFLAYFSILGIGLIRTVFSAGKSFKSFSNSSLANIFNTSLNLSEKAVTSDITFEDVAGLDVEKEELLEVVDFLKDPDKYQRLGAKIPKGILLTGSPGTGKTLLAKAIAGESNVKFLALSGPEFVEKYVGVGASRIRDLFKEARKNAPCIIFIDEIDAVGSKRTEEGGGENELNRTLEQLLIEMDGFGSNREVILIGATNRPEALDPALVRPGRIDRRIEVGLPDKQGREDILRIHGRNKPFTDDVDFGDISLNTPGYSGAELENLLNEAALKAARKNHSVISKSDIENALKKITVGLEKKGRIISFHERRITAYHEAGHAIVSVFLETQSPIREVSIIPRGSAGGYTWHKRVEDHNYTSKKEMMENLIVLLGGRAAEALVFEDISSGASNDIKVATNTVKTMIGSLGMDPEIGPIALTELSYSEKEFFGDTIFNSAGEKAANILKESEKKATEILKQNRDLLEALAQMLLRQETVSGEELAVLVSKFTHTEAANA